MFFWYRYWIQTVWFVFVHLWRETVGDIHLKEACFLSFLTLTRTVHNISVMTEMLLFEKLYLLEDKSLGWIRLKRKTKKQLLHFLCPVKHEHTGEHKEAAHMSRPIRSCRLLLSWQNIAVSSCALFRLLGTSERTRSHRPFSMQYSLYVCEAQRSYFPITCPDVHLARSTDIKVINNEGKGVINSWA